MTKAKPQARVPLATSEARHAWLEDAMSYCATLLAVCADAHVPERTRITIGWPGSGGARGKAIGECWSDTASQDRHVEIFVSPRSHESVDLLVTVLHELIHAAVGNEAGHKAPFAKVALAVGLLPPMRSTPPSDDLVALFRAYIASRGEYPAGAIEGMLPGKKKQKTHLLKATCSGCGMVFRVTAKWADRVIECPDPDCEDDEGERGRMCVELPSEEEGE